jgi:hypothetical protein
MTKSQLIKWSFGRDVLDWLGIGQVPPLSWILDVPILWKHFEYAGPAACIAALELIPVVGALPIFTVAAMLYPNKDEPDQGSSGEIVQTIVRHRSPEPEAQPPLYAFVDGRFVPVVPMESHLLEQGK